MTHFPPFSFDRHDRTLWKGASEVRLTPKASSLLGCLLDARGAWVSREQLLATVWPDTHVQPENVKVLVREIRLALGDSPRAPVYVRSLPRRGYAFIAPITDHPTLAADSLASPKRRVLVHRRPELSALNRALYAPEASATPLVIVSGGYGVGKSSLCDSFLRAARASGSARACYGQCFDRESAQEPYFPILDALLRLDRDYPNLVPRALAEHAPNWLALFPQWQASYAGTAETVDLACGSATAEPAMLDQLRASLAVLASDLPLAIVIEDLQWADADTIRALAHLAKARGSRAVVIATCSDGAWKVGVPGCTVISLAPFTARQVAQYVLARFGPGSLEALAPLVHTATAGDPQMVTAAFDGLVERRLVVHDSKGWRRASSTEAIGRMLPDTWTSLVNGQLEQLEIREREAIEAAAAVGFEFSLATIASVLGKASDEVGRILGPLARRGQLIVAGEPPGARWRTDTFRFRHRLYVEAIARQASPLRQRAFERRIRAERESATRVAT